MSLGLLRLAWATEGDSSWKRKGAQMDLEDAPQKSQSSRLPADTPVTKAMAPLLPPQPAHPPRAQDPRQACHQKHRQGQWLTHAWHSWLSFLSPDHPGGSCDSHCPDWNARRSSETKQLSGQLRAAAETIPVCQTEPTVLCPHSYVRLALGN